VLTPLDNSGTPRLDLLVSKHSDHAVQKIKPRRATVVQRG